MEASLVQRLRELVAEGRTDDAPLSLWSRGSVASIGSWASAGSFLSVASVASSGSLLSVGSSGSILSFGSAGSVLSVGSAGSVLSYASEGAVLSWKGERLATRQGLVLTVSLAASAGIAAAVATTLLRRLG